MQIQTKIEMSDWPKTKPTDKSPWQPSALKAPTKTRCTWMKRGWFIIGGLLFWWL